MKDPEHISHLNEAEKKKDRLAFNLMSLGLAFYFFPMTIDRIVMIRFIPESMSSSIKDYFQIFHFLVAFAVIVLTGMTQMVENPKYIHQFDWLKKSYWPGWLFGMASSIYVIVLSLTSKAIFSRYPGWLTFLYLGR